jgi:SAM-dependent methyltransferase
MESSPLFYRYYDTLFAAKDYGREVAAVLRHCAGSPLHNILEIGCGTGSHTLELAKNPGVHVTAVDTDPAMLALAQKKAVQAGKTNIVFAGDGSAVRNMDVCVALFNVVNYICEEEDLHGFFAAIAVSLRLNGVLIFDCWNGTAALLDPPGSKKYEQQCDGLTVRCHLTSQTDADRGIATLNYHLELFAQNGERVQSGNHQLRHRLWTPAQIEAALQAVGLEVETVCLPFRFEQAATAADWKIMFVCRKR